MRRWLGGFGDLLRELLWLPNSGSYMSFPGSMLGVLVLAGIFGLIRLAFSVYLHIHNWYQFYPDIIVTMWVYPAYLFLFPSAILHAGLRLLGRRSLNPVPIFALAFHLQVLHVIIPFGDALGRAIGMRQAYLLGLPPVLNDWYMNYLTFSPGIILGWAITEYAVAKVLVSRLGVGWAALIPAGLVAFLLVLIPTYFVWPTFNTLFNMAFGLLVPANDPRLVPGAHMAIQWGYATHFTVFAVLGGLYLNHFRGKQPAEIQ